MNTMGGFMTKSNLSEITLPQEPSSSIFFSYTYKGTKEEYLHELLQRTWGNNSNPLWKINQHSGDLPSSSSEEKAYIISESLRSLQHKIGDRSFRRASRSFRFRCGEFVDTPIEDLNSTYIWLQLHHSLDDRFKDKLQFFNRSKNSGRISTSTNSIHNIYLLLANDGQAILILEVEHKTHVWKQLIDDIHPFQTNINDAVISLKTPVKSEFYNPQNQPSLENWGYLGKFIGQTTKEIQDDALCPLLNFFGWLIFTDWQVPENTEDSTAPQYAKYHRLQTHHTIYRMHDINVSSKDWNDHRDAIAYYISRGAKLENEKFQSYDQKYQFVKKYSQLGPYLDHFKRLRCQYYATQFAERIRLYKGTVLESVSNVNPTGTH